MATLVSEGTVAAIVGSDVDVAASVSGNVELHLDVSPLQSGDVLVVKVFDKVRSADAEQLKDSLTVNGDMSRQIVETLNYRSLGNLRFAIRQTAGTARTLSYSVRQP